MKIHEIRFIYLISIIGLSIFLITAIFYFLNKIGYILSLGILLASLWLMQKSVNIFNIKQLTIPGFFYISYIIMIFFPSFFIAIDKAPPYRNSYLLAVNSVLLTVPLGSFISNFIFRFKIREIKLFFSKPIEELIPSYHIRVVFGIFLAGSLVIMFFYLREVKTIPLFFALKNPGAYSELVLLREESFKLLETPLKYPYAWLRVFIFPFLVILALGYYLNTRNRGWLLFFYVSLLLGVFYAGLSLAKMPVAALFLIIFLFIYVYKAGNLKIKFIVLSLCLIFLFPFSIILIKYHGMGIGFVGALKAIIRRLFKVPAMTLYYYFEIFPEQVGYLYGRSIGRLSNIMGWKYFNTANFVFRYIFPKGIETGQTNAAFIGNLHADFGIVGVIIGGVFAGFLMQSIQIFLLRKRKTILNLAVYSFLIFAFWLLNITALPVVLLSNGVILVLIFPWIIRILENIFNETTSGFY